MQEKFIEFVNNRLSESGYMLTRPRMIVLKALIELREIDDAEVLWMYISKKERVSLASVYKYLRLFVFHGFICKIECPSSKKMGYRLAPPL